MRQLPTDCVVRRDARVSLCAIRKIGIATRRDLRFAFEAPTSLPDSRQHAVALDAIFPRPSLGLLSNCSLRVSGRPARKSAQIISRQKPRDLSASSISAVVFSGFFHYRQLALMQLEIDDFPSLRLLARKVY